MIIQRLAAAIRRQDWFQVVIEVFIVVVGIFIGLQVDDWNQNRMDRKTERAYLERLYSDFNENKQELGVLSGIHREIATQISAVTDYLAAEVINQQKASGFAENEVRFYALPSAVLKTGTINELISTGRLALITNQSIRDAINTVNSAHTSAKEQLEYMRDNISLSDATFMGRFYVYAVNEDGRTITKQDFNKVLGDTEIISAMQQAMGSHFLMAQARQYELNTVTGALNLIACELGKEECVTDETP